MNETAGRTTTRKGQIDPVEVMRRHAPYFWSGPEGSKTCSTCAQSELEVIRWPCEPYRLAEALAAEQAKVARVESFAARLIADGYSTCIYESAAEMGEIIRDALTSQS
jgi:hypothetical protein